jgi:hypothetical protein
MPRKIRDYKDEYKQYQGTAEQKKNRAERNTARRQATASGSVKKGDGRDVDHKKPLSKGGSNSKSNRRVVSASSNRSFARTKSGGIK